MLVVLVAVGIVPFGLVGWLAVAMVTRSALSSSGERMEAAAVSTGELIDRNLFERYGDVQAFASSPTVRTTPAAATGLTDTYTRLYTIYDLMVVTDARGVVVAVNTVDGTGAPVRTSGLLGRDLSGTDWFGAVSRRQVALGDTFYQEPAQSPLASEVYGGSRVTLPFSAAIVGPDGQLAGVWHNEASFDRIVADIAASARHDLGASSFGEPDIEVRSDGRSLVDADGLGGAVLTVPDDLPRTPGSSGVFDVTDALGHQQLTGYAVTDGALGFAGYHWTILVALPRSAVLAEAAGLRRTLLLSGLGLAALIAVVSYLVARRLSQPMGVVAGEAMGAAQALKVVATDLIDTSSETSNRATTITVAAEQLTTSVAGIAGALEELRSSFSEVAGSAADASTAAGEAVSVVERSSDTVADLGRSSEQIGRVLAIIQSLAKDTHLLALNAAIEASRAGETGRGFAVVADSVKTLADATAAATLEIEALVERIQGDATATAQANDRIRQAVDRINDHSATIAAAVEEQLVTVGDLARMTTSANADADEIAASNVVLASSAERSWTAATSTRGSADAVAVIADALLRLVEGSDPATPPRHPAGV